MALAPCFVVLALSVAHAGGGVARRPAVQVEELAVPGAVGLAPVELPEGEPRYVSSLRVTAQVSSLRSTTRFTSVCIPVAEKEEQVWVTALLPRRPTFSFDAEYALPTPDWPPTELRWQAKPRIVRVLFRATKLPVAWHLYPQPLEWPAPRRERPHHVAVRVLPPRQRYCGGCCLVFAVPPALSFDRLAPAAIRSCAPDLAAVSSSATGVVRSDD